MINNCPHCGYPTHTNETGFCKSCRKPLSVVVANTVTIEVPEKSEPVKAPTLKKEKKKVKAKKSEVKPTIVALGDDATD